MNDNHTNEERTNEKRTNQSPAGAAAGGGDMVSQIAQAVLYEGYLLYPYRPSTKNRQRWTFGGIFPRDWCEAQQSGDSSTMRTECLVVGEVTDKLSVRVRFLQLVDRQVGLLTEPIAELADVDSLAYHCVQSLRVGGRILQAWQEAVEREIDIGNSTLAELTAHARQVPFHFGTSREFEPVSGSGGLIEAVFVRQQQPLSGVVELQAELVQDNVYRLTVVVENQTPCPAAECAGREQAQLRSLCSAHAILHIEGGHFISLIDPLEEYRELAAGCRNQGAWPVLVGQPGDDHTLLAAPMILYDYPQIAPESPGDLFDGTEIDEILTLRIMTLTDDEKELARSIDERARALLERTEALGEERLATLHGAQREVRPRVEGEGHAAIR